MTEPDAEVLVRFLRASAWLARQFGLSRAEFHRWARLAWTQEGK